MSSARVPEVVCCDCCPCAGCQLNYVERLVHLRERLGGLRGGGGAEGVGRRGEVGGAGIIQVRDVSAEIAGCH